MGVLVAVFIAALVISSLVINSGTDDEIVDMGAPTLPRISFTVDGTEIVDGSGSNSPPFTKDAVTSIVNSPAVFARSTSTSKPS